MSLENKSREEKKEQFLLKWDIIRHKSVALFLYSFLFSVTHVLRFKCTGQITLNQKRDTFNVCHLKNGQKNHHGRDAKFMKADILIFIFLVFMAHLQTFDDNNLFDVISFFSAIVSRINRSHYSVMRISRKY